MKFDADRFYNEGFSIRHDAPTSFQEEVVEKCQGSSFEHPNDLFPSDDLNLFWESLSKSNYFAFITLFWGDFSRLKHKFFRIPASQETAWTHDLFEPYPIKSMMVFGEGVASFGKRQVDRYGWGRNITDTFSHEKVSDGSIVTVCNSVPTFCYALKAQTDLYVSVCYMGWMENQRRGNII